MKLACWVTGDKSHGLGHIIRQLVLADALSQRGVGVEFFTVADTPGAARLAQSRYPVWEYLQSATTSELIDRSSDYAAVLCDVEHGVSAAWLKAVRPHFARVIHFGGVGFAIHDPAAIERLVDLEVYQSVLVDGVASQRVLAGVEYVIIRPEFAQCKLRQDGHIVVCMGGADPHGLTAIAAEALVGCGRIVRVIVGPAAVYPLLQFESANVDVVVAPPNLVGVLDGAALCVCALGMTTYEALAAGVPCIVTNWSADHERTARELQHRGVAINLGTWQDFDGGELRVAVEVMLEDVEDYWAASDKAHQLVDAGGAARVAERICQLITISSEEVNRNGSLPLLRR